MYQRLWSLNPQRRLDKMVNVLLNHLDVNQKEYILAPAGCLFPLLQLAAVHVTDRADQAYLP
jgi:hypothetical protein